MNDSNHVVGGDLLALWRAANVLLPEAQNVYREKLWTINGVSGPPDGERYGKCHPMWTLLASQLEEAMFLTESSLSMVSSALNRSIEAYTYVDGNNANELTKLGEDLEDKIKNREATELTSMEDFETNYDPRLAEEYDDDES